MGHSGTSAPALINYVYEHNLSHTSSVSFALREMPSFLHPVVDFCLSTEPLPPANIDLYILPAGTSRENWTAVLNSALPIIAYGPASLLPAAFENGCADYLKEPWDIPELKARILRILPPKQITFEWGTLFLQGNRLCVAPSSGTEAGPSGRQQFDQQFDQQLDQQLGQQLQQHDKQQHEQQVGQDIELSPPEAAILRLLLLQSGNPVSRHSLQYILWGYPQAKSRAIDVHISTLRKKFNQLAGFSLDPHPIKSIYRYGYKLIHN